MGLPGFFHESNDAFLDINRSVILEGNDLIQKVVQQLRVLVNDQLLNLLMLYSKRS